MAAATIARPVLQPPVMIALALVPLGIGLAASLGQILPIIGIGLVITVTALALHNWRWPVYGLLAYLPFSGIPILFTYPHTEIAVLLKDFLFVIPAYVGFLVVLKRQRLTLSGLALPPLVALVLIVIVQSLNPQLPNHLVPLIGAKVWLLYLPMVFLGYHLVLKRHQLQRVFAVMSCLAVIPAVIGITEQLLLHTDQAAVVYALYGPAAAVSTQNFSDVAFSGGGDLLRIPSTFSFVTQYFTFCASMVAVAYAWWRLSKRRLAFLVWVVMLAAVFTSGARGAFVMVPLLVLLIVLLEGAVVRGATALVLAGVGLVMATLLLGSDPVQVLNHAGVVGAVEVHQDFLGGMTTAFQWGPAGHGTGSASVASRYAFSGQYNATGYGGGFAESWWVKTAWELGAVGLLIVVLLLGWALGRAYVGHRRLQDPGLRAASAVLIAFVMWNVIYLMKGSYIDVDPINVYFWLFLGLLTRIPRLENGGLARPVAKTPTEGLVLA